MAIRQSTAPMQFARSNRRDDAVLQTTMRAGVVSVLDYVPVLRGDSVGGKIEIEFTLADMPKPLLNGVMVNVQSWFVPKSAHPHFQSWDEFVHSYQRQNIKQLGAADRMPVRFFNPITGADAENSDHYKTLGLYVNTGANSAVNDDLFDAYTLVHNFRLAAHSSKLPLRKYYREDSVEARKFARAFWPENRYSRVVPDYEAAIIAGAVPLDVSAGTLTVANLLRMGVAAVPAADTRLGAYGTPTDPVDLNRFMIGNPTTGEGLSFESTKVGGRVKLNFVAGGSMTTSLQDIDKARLAIAMAKKRQEMNGNDATGFGSENTIMAELMSGFGVHAEMLQRPILLGSQMVPFGFVERFSSDSDALDQSLTRGQTRVSVPINMPVQESGGMILTICEIVPERIYERQADMSLHVLYPDDLPDPSRDVLVTLPVDRVENRRIDAKHTAPLGVFGYEGMNDRWNRSSTRLGNEFRQATPGGSGWEEVRSALWVPEIIDPTYSRDHFLVPSPFPHDVFSLTTGPAAEILVRRAAIINGTTIIGDPLKENNADYAEVINPPQDL